jgi:site-specific recombinase XerD
MPRIPRPWYRARDDAWYVRVNEKQVFLAHGKAGKPRALDAYYQLMAREGRTPPKDLRVADLGLLFTEWGRENLAESTWGWYRRHLQSFLDHRDGAYGQLKVSQLTESHVDAWLRARQLGPSTRRGAITALKRLLSWGLKKKRIAENPLKDLERPEMGRRRPLTQAEVEAIFAAVPDREFRDLLTALRLTGARPAEVAGVTAAEVRGDAWVPEDHKSRVMTGKARVIYLNAAMGELAARLIEKHPAGPFFRNTDGNAWTRNAIRYRFRNLRKRLGLDPGLSATACGTPS